MGHTKIVPADLDSCSLLVCLGIDFSCASTVGPIQLYCNHSAGNEVEKVAIGEPERTPPQRRTPLRALRRGQSAG